MGFKPITEQQEREIIALSRSKDPAFIAQAVGVSKTTVYNTLYARGIDPLPSGKRLGRPRVDTNQLIKPHIRELIVHLRTVENLSIISICNRVNLPYRYVRLYLQDQGLIQLTLKKKAQIVASRRKKAVQLYQKGAKVADITYQTGVDANTLYELLRAADIPLRRGNNGTGNADRSDKGANN